MDPSTVATWVAFGTLLLGGGGLGGWWLSHRRLQMVEQPTAAATVNKTEAETAVLVAQTDPTIARLRAETEKLNAEARSVEVQSVLTALQGVTELWTTAQHRLTELGAEQGTTRRALEEVELQMAAFREAWADVRQMLLEHHPWDEKALAAVRSGPADPDFPHPPPLVLPEEQSPVASRPSPDQPSDR